MNFINLQGTLFNLNHVTTMAQKDKYIYIKCSNAEVEQILYASPDDAKVAFSQIKMDIDRMQKHDVSTKG